MRPAIDRRVARSLIAWTLLLAGLAGCDSSTRPVADDGQERVPPLPRAIDAAAPPATALTSSAPSFLDGARAAPNARPWAGAQPKLPSVSAGSHDTPRAALQTVAVGPSPFIFFEDLATGARGYYTTSGSTLGTWTPIGSVSTELRNVGYADFTGDAVSDLLFENTRDGSRWVLQLNGADVPVTWRPINTVPSEWHIAGTASLTNGTTADILWQDTATGETGLYRMNGTTVLGWVGIGFVEADLHLVAVGEFTGDGKPDLVFENVRDGTRWVLQMNGTTAVAWWAIGPVPTELHIRGAGDFTGDGQLDLLFENIRDGSRWILRMNGTTAQAWIALATLPTSWHITGTKFVAPPAPAPTVAFSSITTIVQGQSVAANLNAAAGELDVSLVVDTHGQTLRSVSLTLACPSGTSVTVTSQVLSVLVINTAAFNTSTGVPNVLNGACTLTASASAGATTQQTGSVGLGLTLANLDGVSVTNAFAPYTNAEGITTLTSANDLAGFPWRSGSVTVTAVPVMYTSRSVASVGITLPGAIVPTQNVATPPYSATWSATATTGPRVTELTLFNQVSLEPGSTTPLGLTPSVTVTLSNGGTITPPILNPVSQTTFRLDNSPPQPPTTFIVPPRGFGWVNGAYVFTGVGVAGGFFVPTGAAEYVGCGDGPAPASSNPPICAAQSGISAGPISLATGLNGATAFSYYAILSQAYTPANATNGTATTAAACSLAGWTKINTAGDLSSTFNNVSYVVRVFETDRLGNARCTDLGLGQNTINSGVFAHGSFGVDKVAPFAVYLERADVPDAAGQHGIVGQFDDIFNFTVRIGLSDDASGFTTKPVLSLVRRLAVDPSTALPSTANSAFGCPSGVVGGVCVSTSTSANIPGNADGITNANGVQYVPSADASGCVGCGYFSFTQNGLDLARNLSATLSRTVLIDRTPPVTAAPSIPSTLVGGSTVLFPFTASDNLDLVSSDFTLRYPINPNNTNTIMSIRFAGLSSPILGVAFDNALTTTALANASVPNFIRNMASTGINDVPQNNGVLPTQIAVRTYDAANNASNTAIALIPAANVPQPTPTNYAAGGVFQSFRVVNSATTISNCPTTGCLGGAPPSHPTSVVLQAAASGALSPTPFAQPFTIVQFYYFDLSLFEWVLIGSSGGVSITDNGAGTVRTFTWTLGTPFDPPASLGTSSTFGVVAVGINALGDALVSAMNLSITLSNP